MAPSSLLVQCPRSDFSRTSRFNVIGVSRTGRARRGGDTRRLFPPTILTLFVCFPPRRTRLENLSDEHLLKRPRDIETESGFRTWSRRCPGPPTDCFGNLNQRVTHNLSFSAGKLARGQHNGAARRGRPRLSFPNSSREAA